MQVRALLQLAPAWHENHNELLPLSIEAWEPRIGLPTHLLFLALWCLLSFPSIILQLSFPWSCAQRAPTLMPAQLPNKAYSQSAGWCLSST